MKVYFFFLNVRVHDVHQFIRYTPIHECNSNNWPLNILAAMVEINENTYTLQLMEIQVVKVDSQVDGWFWKEK